jgi:hypothetical protein
MTLKAKQIEHAKVGMHTDGGGLYLRVRPSGAKFWIFRFQLNGRRREMGIGRLTDNEPTQARAVASQLALRVRSGIDPIEVRQQIAVDKKVKENSDLFRDVAAEYIKSHRDGWCSAKHAGQ